MIVQIIQTQLAYIALTCFFWAGIGYTDIDWRLSDG